MSWVSPRKERELAVKSVDRRVSDAEAELGRKLTKTEMKQCLDDALETNRIWAERARNQAK